MSGCSTSVVGTSYLKKCKQNIVNKQNTDLRYIINADNKLTQKYHHDPECYEDHLLVCKSCEICDCKFKEKRLLMNHMLIHENSNKLTNNCSICPGTFSSLPNLAEHYETAHEIKMKVKL